MQALNCPLRARRWGCVSQQSQRPVGPLLLGVSAPLGVQRQLLIVQAARGFGKTKPKKDDAVDGVSGSRRKTKNVKVEQSSIGPIPGQAQQQVATTFNDQLLVPNQPTEEDDDFATRLALLKEQGRERAAELKAASSPAEGTSAQSATSPAIFDVQEDIYANPPPITQTLMGAAGESSISDPKLRDANIGPSQLGLAAGAIVFVAIFIIVAAGDYAPASKRYSGVRPAQQPPDAIEEKILKGKVALYEDQLKADPTNTDATEALATAYARLLQYDKAAELLEKLTARLPNDAEAWRLLGESSLLSQQPRKAVPAFERAVQLRVAQQQAAGVAVAAVTQPDLQLLTGLTDAYIANSDYTKAVDYLASVRQRIADSTAAATAAPADTAAAPAPASTEAAADAAAPAGPASELSDVLSSAPPAVLEAPPLTGDAPEDAAAAASTAAAVVSLPSPASPSPASAASPTGSRPVDPVGVELLTAKVYSAWRGHDNDALAAYDRLIKAFPEDYRGYLAKGVFLREKGRKADAERMFLQARFFAPGNKQSLVRAIADATPAPIALPDNN